MELSIISALKAELRQFTGSEIFYQNPLFKGYIYTEGVKHLAERAEAYWLIDYVFSHQLDPKRVVQPFQSWEMLVEDNRATVMVEDGNKNKIGSFTIGYTDFPLEKITLWLVDKTLLLPSEY